MASKNELVQALNSAFSGTQLRAILAAVDYVEDYAVTAAGDPANLPIATTTTLGVVSVGTGLDVSVGGELTTSA